MRDQVHVRLILVVAGDGDWETLQVIIVMGSGGYGGGGTKASSAGPLEVVPVDPAPVWLKVLD
jgi:hypothetical protein